MLKTIVKEYDKEERLIDYDQSSVFDEEEEKKIKEKSEIVSNILTNPNLNNTKSVYNEEEKKKIKEKSEIDILNNYNINNSNINNQIKENPFHIIFFSEGFPYPLKVEETDKLKDIFKKYVHEVKKNLKQINFIYNGKIYTDKSIKNETVNNIVTDNDKKERVMHITVATLKKNEQKNSNNNKNKSLLIPFCKKKHENREKSVEELFYTKNFIILIIQYSIILLIDIFGFAFKFNDPLISYEPIIVRYIPLFIIVIIFIIFTKNFRNSMIATIIFIILFPIMMIIYTLMLSELIESKYIITGISLIFIYIISLRIHFLIFKNPRYSRLVFLLLSVAVPSFVAFLLFAFIWIKDSLGIFIIFVFWVATIIYYMLWIFISFKSCRLHEYFYSVLIFDYGILLGFPYIIINFMIDYMKIHRIFRIFFILLYQYLIIDMIVWIYVSRSKTYQDKYNEKKAFNEAWLYTLCFDSPLAFICYMVFIVDYIKDGIECLRKGFWQLFLILYVPIMILGYILLEFIIKEDYIYCFIFEIFFILLFLSIYTFIVKEDVITIYKLFFICLISNIITLIPFYFIF